MTEPYSPEGRLVYPRLVKPVGPPLPANYRVTELFPDADPERAARRELFLRANLELRARAHQSMARIVHLEVEAMRRLDLPDTVNLLLEIRASWSARAHETLLELLHFPNEVPHDA
jgi:hypothetical protein